MTMQDDESVAKKWYIRLAISIANALAFTIIIMVFFVALVWPALLFQYLGFPVTGRLALALLIWMIFYMALIIFYFIEPPITTSPTDKPHENGEIG